MGPLREALSLVFPVVSQRDSSRPGAAAFSLAPLCAAAAGLLLALSHELWFSTLPLPAETEALAILCLYALLTGGRPLRGLAELVGAWPGASSGRQATGAALALFALALGGRECLAILAGVRDDISYPGALLIGVWPVAGRWGSALAAQFLQDEKASPLPFLAVSSFLLAAFLIAAPRMFFIAPAGALLGAAFLAWVLVRRGRNADLSLYLDATAGIAELIYLALAASLTLHY